ncbi:SufD family Fe-S cluster assembly protein [Ligilactobacillus sp. LYQ139]|uniref:SufD family Fe-S cluster assembly protein n=1 Tax=Ligilactobacillus sp. LYQ139 TaxID=3378800 RepID=UPI00385453C3
MGTQARKTTKVLVLAGTAQLMRINTLTGVAQKQWRTLQASLSPQAVSELSPATPVVIIPENATATIQGTGATIILAGPASHVKYCEVHQADGLRGSTFIAAEPASHVDWTVVNAGRAANETRIDYVRAARAARVTWRIGELTTGQDHLTLMADLVGESAHVALSVAALAGRLSQQQITARITHQVPATTATIAQYGVVLTSGRLNFDTTGRIVAGARQAAMTQRSKVLLMTPQGTGTVNPQLLIDEDDVTAAHAASIGRLAANQFFYLQSRGLSRQQIVRLIARGFLGPVIDQVKDATLRQTLQALIERQVAADAVD